MSNTKDIEDIVEEFWVNCHGKSAYEDGWILLDGFDEKSAQDWLRNTLTQHHQAEVERMQKLITETHSEELQGKSDDYKVGFQDACSLLWVRLQALTSSKTDKQ